MVCGCESSFEEAVRIYDDGDITVGGASYVGPEILLKAAEHSKTQKEYHNGTVMQLEHCVVAADALCFVNGFGELLELHLSAIRVQSCITFEGADTKQCAYSRRKAEHLQHTSFNRIAVLLLPPAQRALYHWNLSFKKHNSMAIAPSVFMQALTQFYSRKWTEVGEHRRYESL